MPDKIALYGSLLMPPKGVQIMSQVKTEITVNLPDGSKRSLGEGSTGADLAKSIAQGLYREAVGVTINGELRDLFTPLK
ncbi:MAG: TGS domain-containing protein, partial [Terriglobales bacterium]